MVVLKILVTDASGLLGHRIYSAYREHVLSIGVPIRLDITDEKRLLKTVSEIRPDAIINAAAYTDVDGCEANRDLRGGLTRRLRETSRELLLKQAPSWSSSQQDYVFDGSARSKMREILQALIVTSLQSIF